MVVEEEKEVVLEVQWRDRSYAGERVGGRTGGGGELEAVVEVQVVVEQEKVVVDEGEEEKVSWRYGWRTRWWWGKEEQLGKWWRRKRRMEVEVEELVEKKRKQWRLRQNKRRNRRDSWERILQKNTNTFLDKQKTRKIDR